MSESRWLYYQSGTRVLWRILTILTGIVNKSLKKKYISWLLGHTLYIGKSVHLLLGQTTYMQVRFVDIVPTHFNIATFPKNLLTVLALWFCPAVCSLDMTHRVHLLGFPPQEQLIKASVFLMEIQISQWGKDDDVLGRTKRQSYAW